MTPFRILMCWSIIISIIFYILYTVINIENVGKNPQNLKHSEMLQKIIEFGYLIDDTNQRTDAYRLDDPYEYLISKELRPAYEEMASIKKQTEIYEGMERIPGGPRNFMETALNALEKLANRVSSIEDQYRTQTAKKLRAWDSITYDMGKSQQLLKVIMEEKYFEELAEINIGLDISPDNEPETMPKTLSEILDELSNLQTLLKRLEILFDDRKEKAMDIMITTEELNIILAGQGRTFPLVSSHIHSILDSWERKTKDIDEHYRLTKVQYELLVDTLTDGVTRTKERINNLRYPKKPRKEL